MATYIHELTDWPRFRWSSERIAASLAGVSRRQGRIGGRMEALGFQLREEAALTTLTVDVLKSSEIEGEILDRQQVRSSIARRLGMDIAGLTASDRMVDGVVEMMLDATQRFDAPLTAERLFSWHTALFPTGRSGMNRIVVGAWRTAESGPMQVVSGPIGKETIHYQAPAAARLGASMQQFLDWYDGPTAMDPILKAAIAHFWFVTVHPFEDGNGRIARAIADMTLARADNSPRRFYSMSAQIQAERKRYYAVLESAQKGDLDITPWLEWFLGCLDRAFDRAETTLGSVLAKAGFWKTWADAPFNDRQRKVLNRLLDGFEGKLTSTKWAALTRISADTALRDITQLVEWGVLTKEPGGGRSTSYALAEHSMLAD